MSASRFDEILAPRRGSAGGMGWLEQRLPLVLAALMLTTAVLYLGYVLVLESQLAYPVDDAWIHQTFARNLLAYGEFVYNPGEPSSASTSPLWTVLLAGSYLLEIDHRIWSYLLGLLFLALTGLLVRDIYRTLFPQRTAWATLAGLGVVLEPHLDWAALSGMETMLFTFLSLLLLRRALVGRSHLGVRRGRWMSRSTSSGLQPAITGILGGLLVMTRPEGLLLFALVVVAHLAGRLSLSRTDKVGPLPGLSLDLGLMLICFVVLLAPYVVFNYGVTGQLFPSTYYAKNVFYAEQTSLSGMARYLLLAGRELLSGPLLVLVPGLVMACGTLAVQVWRAGTRMPLDDMKVLAWLPLMWCVGLIIAYMVRLPAVYHHGRYLMPVIPVILVYGLWGTLRLCEALSPSMRVLAKTIPVVVVAFWAVLWVNGAIVYGWDVKFINDQNVTVARWLRDNAPPDVLVATHDIGAIGYVAERPILDTAGLITPALAPFVRQPDRILSYLESRRPTYLAMYPTWYPSLARDSRVKEVYRVDQPYAIKQGLDTMVIYELEWEEALVQR